MKSPKVKGIGEVVTEYGAKVMKVIKKGLLGRSLFDFYGDIKAQTFRTKESASVPNTPTDGAGGIIYTKSADGKLYYKSNEVAEVELSASDTVLTSEQVQDIVGAMFSGNTETNITVTYQDSDGTIDLAATDTNTTYSEATGSAEGLMSIAHHDKLDGIEAGATADQTQADINGLAITTVGTISSGTWQGTAIASAYLDSDTAHLSGAQTFTGKKTINIRAFAITDSSTHGDAIGDIIYTGLGLLTAGKIYYLRSNNTWTETDADSAASSTGLIGVALGSSATTDGILLRGTVTLSEEIGGTEAIGSKLYLDTTAATATVTAPSGSGDIVRVIGYSLATDDDMIWFNPDGAWVEID